MAEQKFVNLGPIYTTTEKYNALKTAGQLEVGREYKIVDWEAQEKINDLETIREGAAKGATAIQEHQDISGKQDKLVSGTNIKTINENSLLGSGNIEIKTFQAFPDDFKTDGTLSEFVESIEYSSGAKTGMGYLGAIYGAVCPWGSGNAECKVEYVTDWIALVTVSSSNIDPYYWVMNTAEGSWRGFGAASFGATYEYTSYDDVDSAYNLGKDIFVLRDMGNDDYMKFRLSYVSHYDDLGNVYEFSGIQHNFDPESATSETANLITIYTYKKDGTTYWKQVLKSI